ncbi:hypothetical protein MLD38_011783 [Melastoma candidum]|uniref:Uncharacterized protein n=1 Tax=Melastoma candidum TaxID=119954 RepID=A0ACB9R8B1_9MYRT|nr:hypothetical protein MLD38_011783 [Melastoma candidum]
MALHARMVSFSLHPPAAVLLLMVIFTADSLPSIRSSSRSRCVTETFPLSVSASVNEMSYMGHGRFEVPAGGRGKASAITSAREVPTGPNPLHHNHKPITKPRKGHIVTHP